MVPSWWGLLGAGLTAGALDHWLAGLPDRAELVRVEQAQRRLPLALELIAAALAAGAPIEAAVVLAAKGSGLHSAGRCSRWPPRCASVPLLTKRGVVPATTLCSSPWPDLPSGPQPAAPPWPRACRDLAARERQARVAGAEAAIKRAGVMAVLPLALCYLPAFVLVGVVPIVVGLLSSLAL